MRMAEGQAHAISSAGKLKMRPPPVVANLQPHGGKPRIRMKRQLNMTTEQTLREACSNRTAAALASSTGAAAVGAGAASMMPKMPVATAILFLLAGIGIHIGGMVIAHSAGAKAMIAPPSWHQALTIVCWIALIGFAAFAAFPFIP